MTTNRTGKTQTHKKESIMSVWEHNALIYLLLIILQPRKFTIIVTLQGGTDVQLPNKWKAFLVVHMYGLPSHTGAVFKWQISANIKLFNVLGEFLTVTGIR